MPRDADHAPTHFPIPKDLTSGTAFILNGACQCRRYFTSITDRSVDIGFCG